MKTLREYADEILEDSGGDKYQGRDKSIRDAELAFYEAVGVPIDVPMPIFVYDNEARYACLNDAEWQLAEEEEECIVFHNRNPYALFTWSCRGNQYVITGYCASGDRCFRGTDEHAFSEQVNDKDKEWMRDELATYAQTIN